ncbi:MAG: hypothetical protein WCH76_06965, partial [Candidatus Riflemargulisbacteria bacterium]
PGIRGVLPLQLWPPSRSEAANSPWARIVRRRWPATTPEHPSCVPDVRVAIEHLNQPVVPDRGYGSLPHRKVHQRHNYGVVGVEPKRNPSDLRVKSRPPSDSLLEFISLRANPEQPKSSAKLLIMVRNLIARARANACFSVGKFDLDVIEDKDRPVICITKLRFVIIECPDVFVDAKVLCEVLQGGAQCSLRLTDHLAL